MQNAADSRRNIALLASKGNYALALAIKNARQRRIAEEKKERQQQLQEKQEIEWKAFQEAKSCCLENARFSATMAELQCKEALHRKYSDMCEAHKEEMEAYKVRVEADEARRPAVLPRLVTLLRGKESCLASARLYDEALRVRTMIDDLMQGEPEGDDERKQRVLERRLLGKRKDLEVRNLSAYRKVLVTQQLNHQQLARKAGVAEANLRHKADEMAVTHHNQRRALHMPLLDCRLSSSVLLPKASRGTQLRKKVQGDHYYVPSLSAMYGSVFEEGINC